MKAFKLINVNGTDCAFLEGTVPEMKHIEIKHFFLQTTIEHYEMVPHPAPRYQYVITLKGKLRFKVTDGSTFVIEPGIILIANDLLGKGHTWELIEGDEWHRIYLPLASDAEDHFKPLERSAQ